MMMLMRTSAKWESAIVGYVSGMCHACVTHVLVAVPVVDVTVSDYGNCIASFLDYGNCSYLQAWIGRVAPLSVLRLCPAMNRNRSRSPHRHASPTQRRLAKHVSSMCRACVAHVSGMCPPMHMEARPAVREDTVR